MKGTSGLDKPLLLVDVDGVLNVFGFSWEGYEEPDSELEKVFEAMGWTIRFPTGTAQRMARLNEAFDCVWATTWEERANDLIAPHLGVGADWPVIKFKGWARHPTWKLPDVREWCQATRETGDSPIAHATAKGMPMAEHVVAAQREREQAAGWPGLTTTSTPTQRRGPRSALREGSRRFSCLPTTRRA